MADEEVSRTLALSWGLAAAPQRGPKRELSLERIVDAAIAIADAEGLAAVTMQRVAQTFEFSTMALYRYVSTKDDLHHLMLDAAVNGGTSAIDPDDWRSGLREFLGELIAGYRAHPWTLDIPLAPDTHFMPGQVRAADRGLRAMRTLPAPDDAKLGVLMLFSAFARGHAAVEREILSGDEVPPATRALIEEAITPARFPDAARLVRNGAYFGDPVADAGADASPGDDSDSEARGADAGSDAEVILDFAAGVLLTGLDAAFASRAEADTKPASPFTDPESALSPREAYEMAEAALQERTELRKRMQRRVRDLEREENALRRERDRTKELAKAHAREQARRTRQTE